MRSKFSSLYKPKDESAYLFARSISVIKFGDPKIEDQNFVISKARRSVEYLL